MIFVLFCFGFCSILLYMLYVAYHDTITYEEIISQKIHPNMESFNIFFIADIHRRHLNNQTLNKIKQPIHLVLIGGDIVERGVPLERVRRNIIQLKQWNVPAYFVWGNNDYEVNTDLFKKILLEEGVTILEDSVVSITHNNYKLNLIGFQYYQDMWQQPAINWGAIDDSFTILVTHKPSDFYTLQNEQKQKIDLTLAGHTHGGQIRLFGLGFYRKGGMFQDQHTTIFITEGYGYTLLPFRLQTKAECHLITLKST